MTVFERIFAWMTKPWVAIMYIAFIVASYVYFDKPIAEYFYHLELPTKFPILMILTQIGLNKIYLVLLLLLAISFRYIYRRQEWEYRCWFLWLCVVVPTGICYLLKHVLGRARPELWINHQWYGFYGWHIEKNFVSFPSGHTTTITGLMLGLIILFPRYFYLFLAIAFAIMTSRVILTFHYLSDVLATAYLVLLEIKLLLFFLQRRTILLKGLINE